MNINKRSTIDSDLLRTFLAVAEAGNVTYAANVLGRTQSAISVQIRKLENALSVRLFDRQARGMALTEQGHALLPAAQKAVFELDRIGDLFSKPLTGRIRAGIPDDYGTHILEKVLASFAERHPGVEVFVRCEFSVNFPEAIRRGDLDLAIYAAEPTASIGKLLFKEPTVWAANAAMALDPNEPVPLALFNRDCWWRDAATDALEKAGHSYRVAYSSESVAGVKAAIGAGLAVGVLAVSTVDDTMRVLGKREGYPPLPSSSLVLLQSEKADTIVAQAMESALRSALSPKA